MRSFPQSLCHQCQGIKYTQSKSGSLFLMCTRTDVRYPRQPLDVCHHFQAMPTIKLELESRQGGKLEFTFSISDHLLAPLPSILTGESLNHSPNQQLIKSEWVPCPSLSSAHTASIFGKKDTESLALFSFEVEQSLPRVQLCPPGSLFVNRNFQIEWTSTAQRVPVLAILECSQGIKAISEFEQALSNAYKMTFIQ
ncbi:MAG: hypothetical protein CMH49_07620 [Myxococcales bacterium]|nr:hypothetical protein [Myxococcales bacterium]